MTMKGGSAVDLVALYEDMLASAERQKEAVTRGDMEGFDREASHRGSLQAKIESIMPLVLVRAREEAGIPQALTIARRIFDIDTETGRTLKEARDSLIRGITTVTAERERMAAYGSVASFWGQETGFVDKFK